MSISLASQEMYLQNDTTDTRKQRRLSYSESWRLALVGDSGVGKTTFIEEWAQGFAQSELFIISQGIWNLRSPLASERDECRRLVFADNVPSIVHLLKYKSYNTQNLIQNPQTYLLMYSISDRNSFKAIHALQESIKSTTNRDPIFILVGNKADVDINIDTPRHRTPSPPPSPPPPPPSPALGIEKYHSTKTAGPVIEPIIGTPNIPALESMLQYGSRSVDRVDCKPHPNFKEIAADTTITVIPPSPTHSPRLTREVSTSEGERLARQLGCAAFFETSAIKGEGVEKVITQTVKFLRDWMAIEGGKDARTLRE
uniref:small monomeric GTPase n=1 Tax=Volvariella volvacea TaxID=36659 RepID=A0A1B2U6X1_9AGAR|nr:Ras family protein [Volvariella volvacea]